MCEHKPLRSLPDLLRALIDALTHDQARVETLALGNMLRLAEEVLASASEERIFRQLRYLALSTKAVGLEGAPYIRDVYAEIEMVMLMGGVPLPDSHDPDFNGASI